MPVFVKPAERFANPPLGMAAYKCKCGALEYGEAEIVSVVLIDGTSQYRLQCPKCGATTLYHLPHRRLTLKECREARVIRVNQRAGDNIAQHNIACVRCGSTDRIEWHHTAPREFFLDADDWPLVSVCQKCHALWHNTMRLGYERRQKRAAEPAVPNYTVCTLCGRGDVAGPLLEGAVNGESMLVHRACLWTQPA